ncbi:hypothetical protein RxyAA322_07750 [Rubrobacter xylanophilus]|uniref:Pilus assembly protein PilO n=1 Tax=Rubrobacter xylanophilus TaxID=49319 RepID=A0A510HG47_9ACTN|nr:type 4a pilus biogenesis protein PilO [Rubrobacter xylanophilus]BBL78921.1 hypothetical protein RxyAA322_07750 [Rubrobacter xylanophilus]
MNGERRTLLIGALGILAAVVLSYLFLLSPLLDRLQSGVQEREQKEAQLARLREEVRRLEDVRRNAPELERQLLELSRRIPERPEIPTFIVQVEEVARASGVTQLSVEPGTPGAPETGGPYSVVPVTMTFEGTYEEMQDFLLRMQNLVRLVTVNEVSYEPAEGAAAGIERLLRVEVRAEIYFQPEGPTPSGTGETTADGG